MYSADPRITHIPVQKEHVVCLYASLNKPSIAVPGKPAQEVQAYIVGVRNNAGTFTLFVYLWLTMNREAVVYVDHDNLKLDPAAFEVAEQDAVAFVEGMGFMLDNLNFRSQPPPTQQELMQQLPCFTKDHKPAAPAAGTPAAQAERPDTPQVRLARLLASF